MFSPSSAKKSFDSLSSLPQGVRHEVPLHSSRPGQAHPRLASRKNSIASSILSMETTSNPTSHSVYESGVNAISTLLQPPIVRTGLQPHTTAPSSSSHKVPTARDIPPVTLTNIPIIDVAEFNPYLTQVGALYEQLRRVRESEEDGAGSRRNIKPEEQHEGQHDATADHLLRPTTLSRRRGSTSSIASLASIEAPNPSRRTSSGLMRKAAQGPAPLSTIPTVYFDDDFHLENPRTFDVVSERSEVIRPQSSEKDSSSVPRKALATNAILQEKLSWYMDTIEVHLVNSISTTSTAFFTALGSLKELHSEAAESVERIAALRKELKALDEEVATTGLLITQKRRRQENLRQLDDAVSQLRHVVDGLAHCESLVDAGELDQALSGIDLLEKLIAGERNETDDKSSVPVGIVLRDLRGASALQGISQDLGTLRVRVGKAFESQFTNVLLADLRRHAESVAAPEVLSRWSNSATRQRGGGHFRSSSVFPAYLTSTEELKAQLMPNMVGLHRAKYVTTAAMAYRDTVIREIRNLVRRPLPSSTDDDNESMLSASTATGGRHLSSQERSSNLARNLRALGPEDAEELLVKIYINVAETLRRLTTQVKVLLDIASSLSDESAPDGTKSPPARSPVASPLPDRSSASPVAGADMELQEELHRSLDINSLLTQAVDVANDRIVKILKVRAEQISHLPVDFFLRYFTLNLYFANECEAISGRSGTSLKNVVNGHIKEFVQRNRDAEMQKLAQSMEADQWNAQDFSESSSQLLNMILGASTQDMSVWTENNKIWIPYRDLEKAAESSADAAEPSGTSRDKMRPAVVETEKFILPNSAILCLSGTGNFLHLTACIPSMTTDVASSLIAYLQLFNSRCTQLILGAGATRSAGLKNITTKHLALASQALSFMATLVPHIREFVRSQAGSGAGVSSLMGEFDKVRRLLQEHQGNIHQKLVDIMNGRAAIHAKNMRMIDWDASDADSVHAYMEILVKETATLHRVLTKHLPDASIQMIMAPVFARYKEQLGGPLREATPKTEAGQQSMLRDVEFLMTRLGKIEGFGDAGDFLADIVKAKEVEAKAAEPTKEEAAPAPAQTQNAEEDKKDAAGDPKGEPWSSLPSKAETDGTSPLPSEESKASGDDARDGR